MRFSVLTLGCKVNQAESDLIEGNLIRRGHFAVQITENPDICIVNSCAVTAKSEYQSRQLIRRALRSNATVIVTGCYANLRFNDIQCINTSIQIVKNYDKHNIINMIDNSLSTYHLGYSNKSRPLVKVQDGCDNACAYCIVPLARGRSRSIEHQIIIDQVQNLESAGYNEIVLTGIHLGSYGKDLKPKLSLPDILESIFINTKIKRIRLSSIEINDVDERLLELCSDRRICNHMHIPLQSGDDGILHKMRRSYTAATYRQKISMLIRKIPNISLGTDVMVGFPGESDKAFNNTKMIIEEIPYSYLHIFPYSTRPYTPAANMSRQIPPFVKKKRYEILNHMNKEKKAKYAASQANEVLEIIVEEGDGEGGIVGTSTNYLKVRVPSVHHAKKSLIPVRVTGYEGFELVGAPIATS